MTENVEIPEEAYLDRRGEYCAWFKVCTEHGWKDKYLPCPDPACKGSAVGRWPLYVIYIMNGGKGPTFGASASIPFYDEINIGDKHTFLAEIAPSRDGWIWVKYVPAGKYAPQQLEGKGEVND